MSLPDLAILAGGLATRLRPITETIPKSLINVGGEPFITHQLRLVRRQGFRRVVFCVGHLGEQIEEYVLGQGGAGLDVAFSYDGDEQRGTGGALRRALDKLGDSFFVLYGDSYLDVDVRPIYRAFLDGDTPALMTVLHNRDAFDRSNVVFDGRMVRQHRKIKQPAPGFEWIDYGLTAMRAEVLRDWPANDPFDLSVVTAALAEQGQLGGFAVSERFYEIGKPEGLSDFTAFLDASRQ